MVISRRVFLGSALAVSAAAVTPLRAIAQVFPGDTSSLQLHGITTVPFTLSGNHIYIKAMLGDQPFAFIFDTGGAATLSPELQARLGFPVLGKARLGGAGDATSTVDIVKVPQVSIGSAVYRDGPFVVLPAGFPMGSPLRGLPFGGILGREFFMHLVTTIDYEKSTLTFTEPGAFQAPAGEAVVPVAVSGHGLLSVEAAVDGHSGTFDIDSGSSQALTLTQGFVDSAGLMKDFARVVDVEIGRGVGGYINGSAARARTFSLGSIEISAPLVLIAKSRGGVFANPQLGGNIGGELLRRFTVTLDVPNAKMYLRPNALFGRPLAFNRAGLFTRHEGDVQRVSAIVPSSPASEAGVRPGDVVTDVDGTPAAQLSPDQMHDVWIKPAGTRLALGLQRDGKSLPVTLTLRDII